MRAETGTRSRFIDRIKRTRTYRGIVATPLLVLTVNYGCGILGTEGDYKSAEAPKKSTPSTLVSSGEVPTELPNTTPSVTSVTQRTPPPSYDIFDCTTGDSETKKVLPGITVAVVANNTHHALAYLGATGDTPNSISFFTESDRGPHFSDRTNSANDPTRASLLVASAARTFVTALGDVDATLQLACRTGDEAREIIEYLSTDLTAKGYSLELRTADERGSESDAEGANVIFVNPSRLSAE